MRATEEDGAIHLPSHAPPRYDGAIHDNEYPSSARYGKVIDIAKTDDVKRLRHHVAALSRLLNINQRSQGTRRPRSSRVCHRFCTSYGSRCWAGRHDDDEIDDRPNNCNNHILVSATAKVDYELKQTRKRSTNPSAPHDDHVQGIGVP